MSFTAVLACMLSFACGGGGGFPSTTFQVDTLEGGLISVVNDGTGAWDSGTAWIATEDLRIGAVYADGPTQFAVISGVAVDPTGRIFVAEAQASEIRVFEPDGTPSHTIGRDGEGPGEFGVVYGIMVDRKGTLWVRDVKNMRYSAFSPEGSYLYAFPILVRSAIPNWQGQVDSLGRLIDWSVLLPYLIRRDGEVHGNPAARSRDEIEYIPIRFGREDGAQDSLPSIWHTIEYISGTRVPRPFSGTLVLHLDPALRIWRADSREYRVFRRDLEADRPASVFSLPFLPEAVPSEEKVKLARSGVQGRRIPENQILDTKPVVHCIIADNEGHVLVFPHGEDIEAGTAVDVFLDSGVFLGRVQLPVLLQTRPEPLMRNGSLYGVTKDSLDVPYVVRIRMGPESVDAP